MGGEFGQGNKIVIVESDTESYFFLDNKTGNI
jgi:hypothetical protein